MGDRFRIRRLAPNEWRRFRDIRLRSLKDSPEAFGGTYESEGNSDEARWCGWLTGDGWRGDVAAFLAEGEGTGRPIGVAVCALFDAQPGTAHLFAMWVDPVERGRGVGRALVRAVAARAKERGAGEVTLCVTEGNDAAAALYASSGFVGTADPPRPLREGSGVCIVDMRLLLRDIEDEDLVREQIRYYDDRADAYDDVYFRRGTHDVDPDFNTRWAAETSQLEASLAAVDASGDVLELACGTGLWTRFLAPRARSLVAVDASGHMLERTRERVRDAHVKYVRADVFGWEPDTTFDLIVVGFFVAHVPPSRFDAFWASVARWLRPDGVVWIADDSSGRMRPYSGAEVVGGPAHAHHRRLGTRGYTIVKMFWKPEDLTAKLGELGWDAELSGTGEHFLVGTARPHSMPQSMSSP